MEHRWNNEWFNKIKGLEYTSFGCETTFLNKHLHDEIYIQHPQRYEVPRSEHLVYRLFQALYGLNQAPLQWFRKINKFSNKNGLQESSSDGNMYYKNHSKKVVLLIIYIDDSFLTRDNIERVSWLKKELTTKFDMTSLGLCSKYFKF